MAEHPGPPEPPFPPPPGGDPDGLARLARTFATAAAGTGRQEAALRAELRASDEYVRGRRAGRLRTDLAAARGELAALQRSLHEAAELLSAAAEALRTSQAEVAALEREAGRVSSSPSDPVLVRAGVQQLRRAAEQVVDDQRVRELRMAARLQQLATAGLPATASSPAAAAALARTAAVGPSRPTPPRGLGLLRALVTGPAARPSLYHGPRDGARGVTVELAWLARSLRAVTGPPARPVTLVAAVLGGAEVPRRTALFAALRLAARAGLGRAAPATPPASAVALPSRLLADAVGTGDD